MQLAVPEVTDIKAESEATRELYGLNGEETRDFGRSCLFARRMLECGVRHVQLFSGGSFGSPRINWDGHEDMKRNHGREAARIDQPVATLLKGGMSYGATDEVGYKSDLNPVPWHDFHATVLHLLGIDHTKLTYYHNGIQRRLTNVHGDILNDIIA